MDTAEVKLSARRPNRHFFLALAGAIVIFVFAGFSRTFYLHQLFGMPAPAAFMTFHGLLMSGWVLLLLAQTALVAKRRVLWHRRLGVFGACYAAILVGMGCAATLIAAAREVRAQSVEVASQLTVLALELTQMLLFAGLVGTALWLRHRYEWHKRLMLMATLCILPNVIVRIAFMTTSAFLQRNFTLLVLWSLFVLAVFALDSYRTRRLHAAFGLVGAAAVVSLYAAYFLGLTQSWQHFATWLVS